MCPNVSNVATKKLMAVVSASHLHPAKYPFLDEEAPPYSHEWIVCSTRQTEWRLFPNDLLTISHLYCYS